MGHDNTVPYSYKQWPNKRQLKKQQMPNLTTDPWLYILTAVLKFDCMNHLTYKKFTSN